MSTPTASSARRARTTAWRGRTAMDPGTARSAKPSPARFSRDMRRRSNLYHGYLFKVLNGQGPAAPLGAIDFLVHGAMIGGFAMVASPAEYGVTGVQTFIVSHDGVVYQQDFGAADAERLQDDGTLQPGQELDPRRRAVDRSRRRRVDRLVRVRLVGQIDRLAAKRDPRAGRLDISVTLNSSCS